MGNARRSLSTDSDGEAVLQVNDTVSRGTLSKDGDKEKLSGSDGQEWLRGPAKDKRTINLSQSQPMRPGTSQPIPVASASKLSLPRSPPNPAMQEMVYWNEASNAAKNNSTL